MATTVLVFGVTLLFSVACTHSFLGAQCVDRFHDFRLTHSNAIFATAFAVGAAMVFLLPLPALWRSLSMALFMALLVTTTLFEFAKNATDALKVGAATFFVLVLVLLLCGGSLAALATVGSGVGCLGPCPVPGVLVLDPWLQALIYIGILLGVLAWVGIDSWHLWDMILAMALVLIPLGAIAAIAGFAGLASKGTRDTTQTESPNT